MFSENVYKCLFLIHTMVFDDILGSNFEELFSNSEVVFIAFVVLIFLVTYSILTRSRIISGNRGVSVILALTIALLSTYQLREYVLGLQIFSFLFIVAAVLVLLFILYAFTRKRRKRFKPSFS